MKKFIIVLVIFTFLTALIVTHSIVMYRFGRDAEKICAKIEEDAMADRWEETEKGLDRLKSLWEKKRLWATLTLRTNVIEEIDITLAQSKAHAKTKQKPDFLGEFIKLKLVFEHIPRQEGLSLEEIL